MDLLDHLDSIERLPDGGYRLAADAREWFERYLARYSFALNRLTTCDELVDALRYCNALDFQHLVDKPAPAEAAQGLHFLWKRLRTLGR